MDKKYFGVMLDLSRNAVMTVPSLKRYIDALAKMGYNMLMLYTEETYEVTEEPLFGYLRGRYSKDELKEIVNYGDTKGIELVPCIQALGHLSKMFRWSHFEDIHDRGPVLLADEEKTYEFFEKLIKNVRECFKSDHIHLGCDETFDLGLGKYKDIHGFTDPNEIYSRHVTRCCEIVQKYGFTPALWSDMFITFATGKYYNYDNPNAVTEEVAQRVPKGAELIYADYFTKNQHDPDVMFENHKHFHNKIWMTPAALTWTGFTPHNVQSQFCLGFALDSAAKYNIENIFIAEWGDEGGETSYFSVLPSLFFAAERHRGNRDMDDIKAKFEKLFGIAFDDFMKLDYPSTKDAKLNNHYEAPDRCLLYNDPFVGIYDDLVTEEYPKWEQNFADHAKELHELENNAEYGYLFSSAAALCELMSVKVALGYKTRKAYKAGDKAALKNLLPDYLKAIELVDNFYEKLLILWHTENKAHGFEIQDLRLGGLTQRLKHCHDVIEEYLAGKISKIEQLEEDIQETSGGDMFEYRYGKIASPCKLSHWMIT